jgi:ABC-type branched-subunit amino acid transport system ATPase component
MSDVLLQTDGLTMDFGGIRAVNDLSISVARDEIVAVIGPNGSGKTTLFNLIMHLYHWTGGRILFGIPALDLASLATHRINAFGIARTFQTIRLFPKLTVLENVLVGMHSRLHGGLLAAVIRGSRARREERRAEAEARELLSLFGQRLLSMYDEPAEALSYANRRRLEVARALASKPKLLLLDEPAAGMNPTETREAMDDIRRIRSTGCSILVIEHDMSFVEGLADRVIAMDHGTKIAEGSFQQVRSHPEVIRAYLGSGAYAESVATESAPDRKEIS